MKTLMLLVVILLCSCTVETQTVYNYPNAIVVDKGTLRESKLQLRMKNPTSGYTLKWLTVPREEYHSFELGDTIR